MNIIPAGSKTLIKEKTINHTHTKTKMTAAYNLWTSEPESESLIPDIELKRMVFDTRNEFPDSHFPLNLNTQKVAFLEAQI